MNDYSTFEILARKAIEEKLGVSLNEYGVDINGKKKKFDLVNKEKCIVGDVKNYRLTKSGNNPSAKFSILNEYVWLMQLLEKHSGKKWTKLFVIGEDYEMVKKYIQIYDAWLDDVEIYFFSRESGLKKVR